MKEEKPIILVVEDETDVLRINARMLTRRGYTVYTAENCRQHTSGWRLRHPIF